MNSMTDESIEQRMVQTTLDNLPSIDEVCGVVGIALWGAAAAFRVAMQPVRTTLSCSPGRLGIDECVPIILTLTDYSYWALVAGSLSLLVSIGVIWYRTDGNLKVGGLRE